MEIKPIGYFHCESTKNYDLPRQAHLNNSVGLIRLEPQHNYEQALADLSGFSHAWIIYLFDNTSWKPKVQTPRSLEKKGVFATRSPYRPNPIGLSLVELVSVDKLNIKIKNFDLLNKTQIIDIKPYLNDADFPKDAKQGWLDDLKEFNIEFTDQFYKSLITNVDESPNKIISFILNQLKFAPINHPNKRVKPCEREGNYILAYQYYRINFTLNNSSHEITIIDITDTRA